MTEEFDIGCSLTFVAPGPKISLGGPGCGAGISGTWQIISVGDSELLS